MFPRGNVGGKKVKKKQLLSISWSRLQPFEDKNKDVFRLFFRLSAHFRPHSGAIVYQNTPHIFCPLSAYNKWWFEQKSTTFSRKVFRSELPWSMSTKSGPVFLGFSTSSRRSPTKFTEPAYLGKLFRSMKKAMSLLAQGCNWKDTKARKHVAFSSSPSVVLSFCHLFSWWKLQAILHSL